MIVSLILLAMLSSPDPCTKAYDAFVEVASKNCVGEVTPKRVEIIRSILKHERDSRAGLIGLLAASACRESRFNPNPMPPGDNGLAVGLLQLHPWWALRYGIDRSDPIASVRAYLHRIGKLTRKAKRLCENRDPYLVAQSWVAAGPDGYRCRYSRHYSLWRRWLRKMLPSQRACMGYGRRLTKRLGK